MKFVLIWKGATNNSIIKHWKDCFQTEITLHNASLMALQIKQQEMNSELKEENTMLQKKIKGNLFIAIMPC